MMRALRGGVGAAALGGREGSPAVESAWVLARGRRCRWPGVSAAPRVIVVRSVFRPSRGSSPTRSPSRGTELLGKLAGYLDGFAGSRHRCETAKPVPCEGSHAPWDRGK